MYESQGFLLRVPKVRDQHILFFYPMEFHWASFQVVSQPSCAQHANSPLCPCPSQHLALSFTSFSSLPLVVIFEAQQDLPSQLPLPTHTPLSHT